MSDIIVKRLRLLKGAIQLLAIPELDEVIRLKKEDLIGLIVREVEKGLVKRSTYHESKGELKIFSSKDEQK